MGHLSAGPQTASTAKRVESRIASGGSYFRAGAAADVLSSVAGGKLQAVFQKLGSKSMFIRASAHLPMIEFLTRASIGLLNLLLEESAESLELARGSTYSWIKTILRGKGGEDPGIDEGLRELAEPPAEGQQAEPVGSSTGSAAAGAAEISPEQRVVTLKMTGSGYEVKGFK